MDELTAFARCKSASGLQYRYSAPEGSHNDCVTAIMLAFAGEGPGNGVLVYYREKVKRMRERGELPPEN